MAYNAKTGKGFFLPDSFADCYNKQDGFTPNKIEFQVESCLVRATGSRYGQQEHCETVYYLVEQDQFKAIRHKNIK